MLRRLEGVNNLSPIRGLIQLLMSSKERHTYRQCVDVKEFEDDRGRSRREGRIPVREVEC